MTTFSNQSNDKIHVDNIPRGSAKMDPYTKSAMSIDAVKQVEKTIKRKPNSYIMFTGRQFGKDGKRK